MDRCCLCGGMIHNESHLLEICGYCLAKLIDKAKIEKEKEGKEKQERENEQLENAQEQKTENKYTITLRIQEIGNVIKPEFILPTDESAIDVATEMERHTTERVFVLTLEKEPGGWYKIIYIDG